MNKLILLTILLVSNYAIASTETLIKNRSRDTIYVCGDFYTSGSPDNFKVLKPGEDSTGRNVEHIAITKSGSMANSELKELTNKEACNAWLQNGAKGSYVDGDFFWNDLWVGKDKYLVGNVNHMSEIIVGFPWVFKVSTGALYNKVTK